MHVANLEDRESLITADGSAVREVCGPAWTPARNQSLAEATVPVGGATVARHHRASAHRPDDTVLTEEPATAI